MEKNMKLTGKTLFSKKNAVYSLLSFNIPVEGLKNPTLDGS